MQCPTPVLYQPSPQNFVSHWIEKWWQWLILTLNFSLNEWSSYPLLVIIKCFYRSSFEFLPRELLLGLCVGNHAACCDFLKARPGRSLKFELGVRDRRGQAVRATPLPPWPAVRVGQSTFEPSSHAQRALLIFLPEKFHVLSWCWEGSIIPAPFIWDLDPLPVAPADSCSPAAECAVFEPVPHLSQQRFTTTADWIQHFMASN